MGVGFAWKPFRECPDSLVWSRGGLGDFLKKNQPGLPPFHILHPIHDATGAGILRRPASNLRHPRPRFTQRTGDVSQSSPYFPDLI